MDIETKSLKLWTLALVGFLETTEGSLGIESLSRIYTFLDLLILRIVIIDNLGHGIILPPSSPDLGPTSGTRMLVFEQK